MKVNGCDCSIIIKTVHYDFDVPYAEETIRDAYSLLQEEAAIEGDGQFKAIRKNYGVTGCVVTPLTIGTAPLLLYLAMGSVGKPVFVSETRNLYQYRLNLLPLEDTDCFNLVQDRGGEKRFFEDCRIKGFELRFEREQNTKLKLDIYGERPAVIYPYTDITQCQSSMMNGTVIGSEYFNGDNAFFYINNKEYKNIYGLTISAKKEGGTKTEIWIRRVLVTSDKLDSGSDIPEIIEEFVINTQLLRDKYEYRRYGTFSIKLKNLVLVADETNVNSADTVIGPLRYYVSGSVSCEVFTSGEGVIA